ncbi:hypothetical protein KCP75_15555 [Salmonella enterica subsp. enterica]|nr:hypothetical protein KCP75_15555 [Salmonella enterica subsp. enterica]
MTVRRSQHTLETLLRFVIATGGRDVPQAHLLYQHPTILWIPREPLEMAGNGY